MIENIFAAFLGLLVVGAGVWAWVVDNKGNKSDNAENNTGKEEENQKK